MNLDVIVALGLHGQVNRKTSNLLRAEGNDLAPSVRSAPDAGPQTCELYNLAVIHKQVNIDAKLSNVPIEHTRVSGLKHNTLRGELFHNPGYDVGPPRLDVLSDALGLDHQALDAGIEELMAKIHQLAWV